MLAHVATAALYDSKLKAICARVRHWSRYDLSLLGRAHVAKQVLASTLSYHATFLPPPPDTLAKISRILSGYVMRNQLVEDGGPPLRGRPSKFFNFFFGIYKTKRYIDTLGVHSWEPPGTSRYAQHQR